MTPQQTSGDTAPDQVARLLALVPYLLARGEVRLDEAAEHFGIPPAQLDRDLRLLFMTGLSPGLPGDLIEVDIDALEGEGVIRVDNADYLARPIRFSPAEATALVVALRTLLEAAPEDAREVVERTLAKLEDVAGTDPASVLPLHVAEQRAAGAEHVDALERAIAAGRQVEIAYHVPSRDEQSSRVVDPRAVARVENVLYLDAWCNSARDDRAFRLDRILSVTELDTPVGDAGARPRDLTGAWFAGRATIPVTLRLAPRAAWVVEYYPVVSTRSGPHDTLDVDLEVASEEWLSQLLLRLAPHATVVDPPELGEAFTRLARQTLGRYEVDGVG